jgi:hypothetical protein
MELFRQLANGGNAVTISAPNFYRNLGLAGGSLWLIEAGMGFAIWSLATIHSSLATALPALAAITAVGLLIFGIRLILITRKLPHEPEQDPQRGPRLLRRFGLVVAAEAVGCTIVSLGCSLTHHSKLIVPLTLIVVGLHFLPLASLFRVPRYNMLGALFCAIPIATIVSISSAAHIGHALSWIAVPSLACGLVALATGAAGLDEVQRFLSHSRTPSPLCV